MCILATSPAPPAPSAGAVQRSKSVEGWVMALILKTAAAWSIVSLAMVNRYTFVVVNRECGTGESLHIRHGQSWVCGNGESLHIRRGQRHQKKTTKDQTTTITKDHHRPDDQRHQMLFWCLLMFFWNRALYTLRIPLSCTNSWKKHAPAAKPTKTARCTLYESPELHELVQKARSSHQTHQTHLVRNRCRK